MSKNATFHIHVKSERGCSQVPRTRFQCYWNQYATLRPWSQIATNHKLRRQGFLLCRNLWRFKTQLLRLISRVPEGILLSRDNMFTYTSDNFFQEGFLCYVVYGFYNWYAYKQIYQWINTKMVKNATFHIHVKGEPGYSPKYPQHVFSVIGINMPRHGLDL